MWSIHIQCLKKVSKRIISIVNCQTKIFIQPFSSAPYRKKTLLPLVCGLNLHEELMPLIHHTIISQFSVSRLLCKRKKEKILKTVKQYTNNEDIEESEIFDDDEYNNLLSKENINLIGHSSVAIIQPWIKWGRKKKRYTSPQLLLDETCALVNSLPSMTIAFKECVHLSNISASHIFGTGTTIRLIQEIKSSSAKAIFISVDCLSRVQKSELEELFGMRVFDRLTMVLSIFKFYAQTMEARLQIALAELPLMRSSILTENEKMIMHQYEAKLKNTIAKLAIQRSRIRENRKKIFFSSVAIVGYTNCGKTTLIHRLTGDEKVQGEDRLFATLDVTAHRGSMPCGLSMLYLDSVGFIQDIPTNLIASFQATLQDALNADVIVHIRDISHPDIVAQTKSVNETLEELSISKSTPIIVVNNKSDLLEQSFQQYSHLDRDHEVYKDGLYVSAINGQGLKEMLVDIEAQVIRISKRKKYSMKLPIGCSNISWLKNNMNVTEEEIMEDLQHTRLFVLMNEAEKALYIKTFNL